MTIHMSIRHDGRCWIVEKDDIRLSAPTLEELDEKIREFVLSRKDLHRGKKTRVYMAYDNYAIPQWIRQYSSHYFDRIIEVEI